MSNLSRETSDSVLCRSSMCNVDKYCKTLNLAALKVGDLRCKIIFVVFILANSNLTIQTLHTGSIFVNTAFQHWVWQQLLYTHIATRIRWFWLLSHNSRVTTTLVNITKQLHPMVWWWANCKFSTPMWIRVGIISTFEPFNFTVLFGSRNKGHANIKGLKYRQPGTLCWP